MDVIDKIIEIEKAKDLFSYKDAQGLPLWDVLRYDIIKIISARTNPQSQSLGQRGKTTSFIKLFLVNIKLFLKLLFIPSKNVWIHSAPRNINAQGVYFDKIAEAVITMLGAKAVVTETGIKSPNLYKTYPLPEFLFHAIYTRLLRPRLDEKYAYNLVQLLNDSFNQKVITVSELNKIYTHFMSSVATLDFVAKRVRPKKIVTSDGRYKAMFWVAKKYGIKTFLMQHSLMDSKDGTVCGTCPDREQGLFPDVLLTFGNYWGNYMKHLCDVVVIGNDYMVPSFTDVKSENKVLFISSMYQGRFLPSLVCEYARRNPSVKIIYKLHANEFSKKQKFIETFKDYQNVTVYSQEYDLRQLISMSKLVVLISSTVFYEALTQKRPVAVWDHPEFSSLTRMHKGILNSHVFNTVEELEHIAKDCQFEGGGPTFYEPFNKDVAQQLLQ